MTKPVCPLHDKEMTLLHSTLYVYGNGAPRLYYGCPLYPMCLVRLGAHPDGTPAGKPGDLATRLARRAAHSAFDSMWRDLGMTRSAGYKLLQAMTDLPEEEAHIGRFDKPTCEAVVAACLAFRDALKEKET